MKVSKFNFTAIAGGVAGGMVSKLVESFTKSDDLKEGEVDYLTIGVQAIGGAAISAFSNNDLLKGIGSGMIGVAGYQLADGLGIGNDSSSTESVSGLLASQNAVGRLNSQRAIGAFKPYKVEEEKKNNSNVQ